MSKIGNMYLGIIQPVTPNTAYAEFLEEHGEGFHYIAIKYADGFVSLMQACGIDEISSAWLGERFALITIPAKTLALLPKSIDQGPVAYCNCNKSESFANNAAAQCQHL